jgi:hypothetical protein
MQMHPNPAQFSVRSQSAADIQIATAQAEKVAPAPALQINLPPALDIPTPHPRIEGAPRQMAQRAWSQLPEMLPQLQDLATSLAVPMAVVLLALSL